MRWALCATEIDIHPSMCYDALVMKVRLRLSSEERKTLAEKLMDWANLVFGGLALTQAFAGNAFNWPLAVAGSLFWITVYSIALWLMKKGKEQ